MYKNSLAQVFFEQDCQGTFAEIISDYDLDDEVGMQKIATGSRFPACVFWQESLESKPLRVRIFNQKQEIQFCGHGLLALAAFLKRQDKFKSSGLEVALKSAFAELKTEKNNVWIGFEPMRFEPVNLSDVRVSSFSEAPSHAALVGDENGYMILEWPKAFDLKNLTLNFQTLLDSTHRAVIATQRAGNTYDFYLRYFAPAYGANEDPATGSANRILATYWQSRLGKSQFTAKQLSASGAVILSKIEKKKVWISGKVKIIN